MVLPGLDENVRSQHMSCPPSFPSMPIRTWEFSENSNCCKNDPRTLQRPWKLNPARLRQNI
ncbi:hypothetical protein CAEBREN_11926 [Caenorhabditis brenneri]|uniref:Uncharacterized protein n=1 Tax=Caenorhabditis brenneri TaxID=135651 RepID=G0NDM7_CAEBE|nr:hypothetical protein CAEBREN_11926 [Caenorhabditis brenneri]